MEQLNRKIPLITVENTYPEKVLMFGEGAFLRAFACYAFDEMNKQNLFNGSVTIVQPIPEGKIDFLKKQDGLFTVVARGVENEREVIKTNLITCVRDCINPYEEYENYIKRARNPELRLIVSNTTEAGISYIEGEKFDSRPQASFPGKVTTFLHERYVFFKGDKSKGLVFLPCELIENNGEELKKVVQIYAKEWDLGEQFLKWIDESCIFANTLVDRIVAGYPQMEAERINTGLGYRDELLDACELFYFWAIETSAYLRNELPLDKIGLNIIFSDDILPYRLRKVRLLNGAHTCLAHAAMFSGYTTVGETMGDERFKKYIEKLLFKEVIPTLSINRNVLEGFAKSVIERFSNPFIRHELQGITLNSVSKFKTRVLPTLLEYQSKFGKIPPILTFSFAMLIIFYKNGGRFKIIDEEKNITFLRDNSIDTIFKNTSFWGAELHENEQFCEAVNEYFRFIKTHGVKPLIERLIND